MKNSYVRTYMRVKKWQNFVLGIRMFSLKQKKKHLSPVQKRWNEFSQNLQKYILRMVYFFFFCVGLWRYEKQFIGTETIYGLRSL